MFIVKNGDVLINQALSCHLGKKLRIINRNKLNNELQRINIATRSLKTVKIKSSVTQDMPHLHERIN